MTRPPKSICQPVASSTSDGCATRRAMNEPKPHEAAASTTSRLIPSGTDSGRPPGSSSTATPANPSATPPSVAPAGRSPAVER